MVLKLLKEADVTLKLNKCALYTNRNDYYGYVIKPGLIEVANHTAEFTYELIAPTAVAELRSFLGLCNGFKNFVPNFARVASPLLERLKKTQEKELEPDSEKELEATDVLKNWFHRQSPHFPKEKNSLHWILARVTVKSVEFRFRSKITVETD